MKIFKHIDNNVRNKNDLFTPDNIILITGSALNALYRVNLFLLLSIYVNIDIVVFKS